MNVTKISRHYATTHIKEDNIDTHIAIYEDQIFGWFIDQVRLLQKVSDHGGLVILHLALSYIEGHAIFYKGKDSRNQSRRFFCDAFKAIFPLEADDPKLIDKAVNELYDQMRCGLFHTGIFREKVVLADFPTPVGIVVDPTHEVIQIQINYPTFLDRIEDHLADYLMRLRNPAEKELRRNFERAWRLRSGSSGANKGSP